MRRDGQAIVEFVVALVAVIVLFAGLLQIGMLAKVHTDTMTEARRKAGLHALSPSLMGSGPDYIEAYNAGIDNINYSADDEFSDGRVTDFSARVISFSRPIQLESTIGPNVVSTLFTQPRQVVFGLEKGSHSVAVELLPIIRNVVYNADSIEIKCDVWMFSGGNLY